MQARLILNNEFEVDLTAENANELNLDFSSGEWGTAFESPNLQFIDSFMPELRATGKDNCPVRYIYKFWRQNGILTKLKAKVFVDDKLLISGYIDMFSENNYINNIYDNYTDVIKLTVKDSRQLVESELSGFNVSSLFGKELTTFKKVAAVLNSVPDRGEAGLAAITLVLATISATDSTQKTAVNISKLATTGSFLGGAAGATLWAIIDTASTAIITAGYIVVLKELAESIYNSLIGEQRYYNFANVNEVLIAIFDKIGYKFKSTIFDSKYREMSIIAPTVNTGNKKKSSANNNPLTDVTALEFVTNIAEMFCGSYRIDNEYIVLERRDKHFTENSGVIIPNLQNNGQKWANYSELLGSISIAYNKNLSDKNGWNPRAKYNVNYSLTNSNAKFQKSKTVNIPYSIGVRKTELNNVEQIYKRLSEPLRKLGIKLQDIDDRVGALLVNDFNLSSGVIFINDNESVSSQTYTNLLPKVLYDNFHIIDSPKNSQFMIYTESDNNFIQISDYEKIIKTNTAKDRDGQEIIIQKNVKDIQTNQITLTYRQRTPNNAVWYLHESTINEVGSYPEE